VPPAREKFERLTHAQARAIDRFGVHFDKYDMQNIAWHIQNNHGKLVEKLHDGLSSWRLTYKGVDMIVVMTKDLYGIATFLKPVMERKELPKGKRRETFLRGRKKWKQYEWIK